MHYIASGNIALSGGSTYKQICIAWSKETIHFQSPLFFPVDERVVPFDDSQSNWGMIYSTFLQPLGFEDQNTHFAASTKQAYCKPFSRGQLLE
jgi:6-phosphogluconolactonase/glucosamine-6-phosphate isomerase/deaminase